MDSYFKYEKSLDAENITAEITYQNQVSYRRTAHMSYQVLS